jgi:NADH:ubiquinone oxidoreductase subunit 2 (subunit N)
MVLMWDVIIPLHSMVTYLSVYNFTLVALFWSILSMLVVKFKTLHAFNSLSFNSYHIFLITVILFSIAGVPPFAGFFTKLLVFVLNIANSFFLFYTLFFIIVFISLYFYIQNIRFLHSTNYQTIQTPHVVNERLILSFYYLSISLLIVLISSFVVFDEISLTFLWLLS